MNAREQSTFVMTLKPTIADIDPIRALSAAIATTRDGTATAYEAPRARLDGDAA